MDLVAHLLYLHDERTEEPKAFSLFVQALKSIILKSEWGHNELVKDMRDDASDSSDSEDESDDSDDGDDDDSNEDDDDNGNDGDVGDVNDDDGDGIADEESSAERGTDISTQL